MTFFLNNFIIELESNTLSHMEQLSTVLTVLLRRNDTQHNDIQHNDTHHNDTQHNNIRHNDTYHNDIQHNSK
jgi:hypothetical protein